MLSVWFLFKQFSLLSWRERGLHQTCPDVLLRCKCYSCSHHISPNSIICAASSCCELTQNMFACDLAHWTGPFVPLNRAFILAGRRSRRFLDRIRYRSCQGVWRRLSGSPGGKYTYEENRVHVNVSHVCQAVSWWESMFSVKSRHNKQWLKADINSQSREVKWENIKYFTNLIKTLKVWAWNTGQGIFSLHKYTDRPWCKTMATNYSFFH